MKSQFFPGEKNCPLLLMLSLAIIFATQVSAGLITENFNSVTTASTTFTTDGILQHSIRDGFWQPATIDLWDINTFYTAGDDFSTNALVLTEAQDYITFTLGPGEYIDSVSVEFINDTAPSSIIIVGENGEYNNDFTTLRSKILVDTTGMGLGHIESIVLYGADSAFDNLIVNHVVPEPITISLLSLGGIMLRKWKKR